MTTTEQNNRRELARRYPNKYSVRIDSGEVYVLDSVNGWRYFGHINNAQLFAGTQA